MKRREHRVLCKRLESHFHPAVPLVGCEVGAWLGGTTNALLKRFRSLHLYIVDPWDKGDKTSTTAIRNSPIGLHDAYERFCNNTAWAKERLEVFVAASPGASALVSDSALDFVLIDGDHRYNAVHDDLLAWWPKVRPGGLVVMHDYRRDRRGRFGVIEAVDEFCEDSGLSRSVDWRTCFIPKPGD